MFYIANELQNEYDVWIRFLYKKNTQYKLRTHTPKSKIEASASIFL